MAKPGFLFIHSFICSHIHSLNKLSWVPISSSWQRFGHWKYSRSAQWIVISIRDLEFRLVVHTIYVDLLIYQYSDDIEAIKLDELNWENECWRRRKKKEEEEEELKEKGKRGERRREEKKEKTGKKRRIKKKRRRKQRGGWGKVQSLNPGSPKFRRSENEEKAAQSIETVVKIEETGGVLEPKLRKGIWEESVFSSP